LLLHLHLLLLLRMRLSLLLLTSSREAAFARMPSKLRVSRTELAGLRLRRIPYSWSQRRRAHPAGAADFPWLQRLVVTSLPARSGASATIAAGETPTACPTLTHRAASEAAAILRAE